MKARDNPFRVARVLSAIRYEVPAGGDEDDGDGDVHSGGDAHSGGSGRGGCGAGVASLLPRLEALRYRAAIVGPHGSGKTTLLEDLQSVLEARGFRVTHLRLDTDHPRLPREWRSRSSARRLDGTDIVCLDGAEQLGPIAWRRFRWQTRRAGGLIVTTHTPGRLPTLIECTTSVRLLERIIERLAPGGLYAAARSASHPASPAVSLPASPAASHTASPTASRTAPPAASRTALPTASRTASPTASRTASPAASLTASLAASPTALPAAPPAAELFARHRGNIREALRELYDVYAAAGSVAASRNH